jgi:carbon monoxide dehydrogenase subunit G
MVIEHTFSVNVPHQTLWDFLFDIPRVSACMPGVEGVEATDPSTYVGKFKVKIGPIAAEFGGKVTLLEVEAPHRLVAKAEGTDARTASLVAANFSSTLQPTADNQTQVAYQIDVAVRGLLGRYGHGVMSEVAKAMTARFARCIEAQLQASQAAAGAPGAQGAANV